MDWPLSPNVGDQVTGPRGEVWQWDGVKWVSVAGEGDSGGDVEPGTGTGLIVGQDQPVINQPIVMGVTDGSNAASGEIGEFLNSTASSNAPNANGNTTVQVNSLLIPPGDWDVTVSHNASVWPLGWPYDDPPSMSTIGTQLGAARLQYVIYGFSFPLGVPPDGLAVTGDYTTPSGAVAMTFRNHNVQGVAHANFVEGPMRVSLSAAALLQLWIRVDAPNIPNIMTTTHYSNIRARRMR